jgi:hypothetical protein
VRHFPLDRRSSVLLVNPRDREYLGVQLTALMQRALTERTLLHVRRLSYALGVMVYHCANLAELYVRICHRMSLMSRVDRATSDPLLGFGYNEEPYFEFDALVAAARRLYDAPRELLWQAFDGRAGQMPNADVHDLVGGLPSIPDALRERLTTSWTQHGARARDYRDCIAHYADSEHGLGNVEMIRHRLGVWSARARIPDNPEVRSRRKFTYAKQLDALDYSLDLTAEVTAFLTAVVEATTSRISLRAAAEPRAPNT